MELVKYLIDSLNAVTSIIPEENTGNITLQGTNIIAKKGNVVQFDLCFSFKTDISNTDYELFIATVPFGYRPILNVTKYIVLANGATAFLTINTLGDVILKFINGTIYTSNWNYIEECYLV